MEITKEQIKELIKIAQAIDNENRIDDDVTGGYVEEPYNNIIERIYAVVNECDGNNTDAGENTLPIQRVMPRFSEITKDSDNGAFSWILQNDRNADHPENNSDMIRRLVHKYNDLVKFLNGA